MLGQTCPYTKTPSPSITALVVMWFSQAGMTARPSRIGSGTLKKPGSAR